MSKEKITGVTYLIQEIGQKTQLQLNIKGDVDGVRSGIEKLFSQTIKSFEKSGLSNAYDIEISYDKNDSKKITRMTITTKVINEQNAGELNMINKYQNQKLLSFEQIKQFLEGFEQAYLLKIQASDEDYARIMAF